MLAALRRRKTRSRGRQGRLLFKAEVDQLRKAARAGDFRKVTVEFKTDSPRADGSPRAEGLALLATTSRFVFLYDPATKRAEAVPLDSIARLVWDARSRKEKAAEAEAKAALCG